MSTVQRGEWLTNVEIGWTPDIERYKTDRVQFTYWHKDALSQTGAPAGQGWMVSASMQATEKLIPFTRFGHSDGGAGVAAEAAAAVGLEYAPRMDQAVSFGAGWARPSPMTFGPGLRDEWVVESSYKVQFSPTFSLMPDLQLLVNPANNPAQDTVWVLGVRGLLSF